MDPDYHKLASNLANEFEILQTSFKTFPDGEFYFRLEELPKNEDVGVLISGYPDQNDAIVKATLLGRTIRDLGANTIIGIVPYFPYARQDKRFHSGEPLSAKIVAKNLLESGFNRIITVDVHSEAPFEEFGERFTNLKSLNVWAKYIKNEIEGKCFLIAPDEGRAEFVNQLAEKAGCDYITLTKKRSLETGEIEEIAPKNEDKLQALSKKCEVAILSDDIISTGGTASEAIEKVKKTFNGKVIAAFTHGVFRPGSVCNLLKVGTDKILATDTIDTSYSRLSVSPLIVSEIREVLGG